MGVKNFLITVYGFIYLLGPYQAWCQQRQHFRTAPGDQQVVEGGVAIVRCEVGHQAGRVQWAKDGFVLGFNRSIPGYPRYEMIGDGVSGEHHLRIHNTTLVDDADYQCQVGPADGHPPIRGTGHLTVLMAPTSVGLVGRGREGVLEVREGEEVTLECRVEEAKPVAQVKWYKNEQEIHLDTREDLAEESSKQHRHNTVSKVTLRLTPADDGSHYTCRAHHPALHAPVAASVKISVLYPPGAPIITGYTPGESLRAGEKRTLTCRSRGGNPLGRVVWYRNNENVDATDSPVGGLSAARGVTGGVAGGGGGRGETINEHTFIADSRDNGAVFTCEVRNKLTDKPLLASVKLDVQFPPRQVEISGPAESKVNENVTLTCLAQNSNPPAEISWVVDGQPRAETSKRRERVGGGVGGGQGGGLLGGAGGGGGGGWDTVSKLDLTVPALDRDVMFTCHATNQALGETKVDTYKLSVLRPPQPPVLHGYSEGTGIPVGTKQRITCVSRGGNPPAHLQWYRNGQKIPSQKHGRDDVSSAEIEVMAEPRDNRAQYRCEAFNSAAASPVSVSTTLVVHFPPETVKIIESPRNLRAGTQATLTCTAGPSNPPATITWLRGGYQMLGRLHDTSEGPYGGTSVSNVLTLNLTSADDGLTYTCQATNPALHKDVRQAVTLRVNYAPTFLTEPPETINVILGESEVLNLTAKANPGPVVYSWTRNGLPLIEAPIGFEEEEFWRRRRLEDAGLDLPPPPQQQQQQQASTKDGGSGHGDATSGDPGVGVPVVSPSSNTLVAARGPLLYIRDVSLDNAGDYQLEASNKEGSTLAKVYVNVLYPPSVKYISRLVTVSEGQDAQLECAADGNPLTEDMLSWQRQHYDFTRTQQSFGGKKASLTVLRANKNDTGVFTCLVENGVGRPARANLTLIVKTKPQVQHSQLMNRAAAGVGGTGRLQCLAEGAPDVSFSWKREGILLSNGIRTDKYENETIKTGLVSWSSTFFIKGVREEDYGEYVCVAENELGASTLTVHFTRPTPPDTPLALKILNTTHDSVTLAWVPGFDGGLPQYFRIRYRPEASSSYQYLDVADSSAYSYTVAGLELDTRYFFSIRASNEVGASEYRGEFVKAMTRNQVMLGDRELLLNQVLGGRGDLPKVVIVVVAVVGGVIVAINITLVICLIRRKRGGRGGKGGGRDDEGSDQASSKSTTHTMYAPSSFNDTVVGETLSSISEKSRESYAQDDSVVDYEESTHKHAASTYLIDQIEPPPEYASQTPSTQPSSAAYDPHEDDYAEVLRRNAYNHQLGKVTPRPPSRATHYSASPDTRGFPSFSYTPSPTGVPNGAAQYHAGGPSVTLGLHDQMPYPQDQLSYTQDLGDRIPLDTLEHSHALQSLGLDSDPPPSLGLEQHSIPSEHPSLTLDPHSITIDHPVIAVTDFSNRNGDLRVVQPSSTATSLSTFHPNPSPSTYSESDMEGHLV